ncbi:hypothetical protein FJY68_11655 [candidate division WOR-3 bacterium]|uniref:Uncharacterized protein n=1 Tax=candidate division WOR-3 bacterium TaxID=2052148 RepID=A0A937XG31_UNCW3|nr:hypothetical protein [candidate division WOR-3 bacterium]
MHFARHATPQTTERTAPALTARVASGSDSAVTLRTGSRFAAEVGRPVTTRIGHQDDFRIAAPLGV